ncbi:MAG TPA: hypothetical protein VMC85_19915 [Desulfomonilaceae bacterium]|nr:hypothetical protein [Desulfomonilaceae bacterium]
MNFLETGFFVSFFLISLWAGNHFANFFIKKDAETHTQDYSKA